MTAFHRSSRWAAFTRKVRPILSAQLPAPCVNAFTWDGCAGVVMPGQAFDVSHIISHNVDPAQPLSLEMVGVAHTRCNRRAGGREGRAKQQRKTGEDARLPPEGSGW
jgi:hypothetical protein